MNTSTFSDRISSYNAAVSLVEQRLLDWLARNRETALHASAAEIAAAAGTSDATVIRTARKLGYAGLAELRRALAEDLRRDLTLADRMTRELSQPGASPGLQTSTQALRAALDVIEALEDAVVSEIVTSIVAARRIHVFGIGPSGFIAGYFAVQLQRLGFDARALSRTGLQFADDLVGIESEDTVIALAYNRPYPEVRALFDRATRLNLPTFLITSNGPRMPDPRARLVLRVPRGRTDGFGMHAGTLALLEGLLVALSAAEPDRTKASLEDLNSARATLSGAGMGL